jgi:hypothetical protein
MFEFLNEFDEVKVEDNINYDYELISKIIQDDIKEV